MQKVQRVKRIFLLGLLFVCYMVYHALFGEISEEEKHLSNLDLRLTGIVRYVDIPKSMNSFGIVGVDVLRTNKLHIDTSNAVKYCIVKSNKAEFYQLSASMCDPGDTIEVDTNNKTFIIKKTNGETKAAEVVIYTNERFWAYVAKKSQLSVAANTSLPK